MDHYVQMELEQLRLLVVELQTKSQLHEDYIKQLEKAVKAYQRQINQLKEHLRGTSGE